MTVLTLAWKYHLLPSGKTMYQNEMQEPDSNVLNVLSELKRLAERGRSTPLLGGEAFVLWGSLIAGFLAFLALASPRLPATALLAAWAAFPAAAGLGMFLLFRKYANNRNAPNYNNRIISRIWLCISAAALMTASMEVWDGFSNPANLLVMCAAMFSVGLGATGVFVSSRWLTMGTIGWLILIPVIYVAQTPNLALLVTAVGAVLFLVGPGLSLMASHPERQSEQ
ncbi:MAG: hypothetical protein AAGJ50_06000 [Pseudomonadota bacterium]